MPARNTIVSNLRRIQRSRGWNQSELATALHVSRQYISQILRGERGIGLLGAKKIASRLGVPLTEVLLGPDKKDKK